MTTKTVRLWGRGSRTTTFSFIAYSSRALVRESGPNGDQRVERRLGVSSLVAEQHSGSLAVVNGIVEEPADAVLFGQLVLVTEGIPQLVSFRVPGAE